MRLSRESQGGQGRLVWWWGSYEGGKAARGQRRVTLWLSIRDGEAAHDGRDDGGRCDIAHAAARSKGPLGRRRRRGRGFHCLRLGAENC